jgi:hypothetical protein
VVRDFGARMITLEIPPMTSVEEACQQARDLADKKQESVEFTFNGAVVTVGPCVDPETVYAAYQGAVKKRNDDAAAQFHADLQIAIVRSMHDQMGHTFFDDVDSEKLIAAIKPFLRTP